MDFSSKEQVGVLISKCIEQDRASQKILFEKFYGKMLVVALTYFNSSAIAEDAVTEAFLKVFNKLNTFDNNGNIEGWIRRIVVNHCVDIIRRDKKIMFHEDEKFFDKIPKNIEVEEHEIKGVPISDVLEMINSLPTQYKAVFNLFVFEEMSHKEIGIRLGIAEGTSKSNFFRARNSLIKKFNKLFEFRKCQEEVEIS